MLGFWKLFFRVLAFLLVILILAGLASYYLYFNSFRSDISTIIKTTSSEHRNLPQPAYDLAKLHNSESVIRFRVARNLLRTFRDEPDRQIVWQAHSAAWALLIELRYSDEELFALWCHYYPAARPAEMGMAHAAQSTYGTTLSSLNLEQTARLVVAASGPGYYSNNPEKLEERVDALLKVYEEKSDQTDI